MKFDIATILKAVFAFVTAASASAVAAAPVGADVAGLDPVQWVASVCIGLGAAGALLHRPATASEKAVASIQTVIQGHEKLAQTAIDSIKAVQDAVGTLTSVLPAPVAQVVTSVANSQVWQRPLGDLAQQVLSHIET